MFFQIALTMQLSKITLASSFKTIIKSSTFQLLTFNLRGKNHLQNKKKEMEMEIRQGGDAVQWQQEKVSS